MGALTRLEQAARELHDVLTDPALGGCRARAGEYPSLLVNRELQPADIRKAVELAVQQAKADNAVLVVALLGHGFTPPQQTELYFMVSDSTTESVSSAVNVRQLLAEAADEAGVDGVIALVDTCHASGASPDTGQVAGGIRAGRTRLSVLTAAAADQPARDMRLTFALVEMLREGLAGAGSEVFVDRTLTEELRGRVSGQTVGRMEYDNDPFALESLWLARNRRYHGQWAADEVVGPLGRQELRQAVEMWRVQRHVPERLTRTALTELHDFTLTGQVEDETSADWRIRVGDVAGALVECAQTGELLSSVFATELTSDLLRAAGRLADFPPEAAGAVPLRDLLEYAALRAQPVNGARWQGLARLMAAIEHQVSGSEDAQMREWAKQHGVITEFNDALAEFSQSRQQQEVRLVVSLAGAWADWPEEVDAWLLLGQSALPARERFGCESADRIGVGKAIKAALDWARSRLPAPELLMYVDVAAPAHLLAQWQPEEEKVGHYLLGVNHVVVARWSGRLDPSEDNAEINNTARKALNAMASCGKVPVEWVGPAVLGDQPGLEHALMAGQYAAAVGLDHHPQDLHEILGLLLPYAPIILWPRADARPANGQVQTVVQQNWHHLPNGFAKAYRSRWKGSHADCPVCLGDIRAVWHDEAWLNFCRPFENRIVAALEEEL
ncbi:vWA-MoxR associated conflict system protein [Streptomyces tauricus]|uniref:vWA-MoxR associated conflict system protein n=1 Tax=Streptomyces tauricus TaxID=68274 RepID=UPI0037F932B2